MSHYSILQLAPPIQHQVRAILALLRRYQWARFGVVMSKMAGSQNFLKMLQNEIQAQEDRSFKFEVVHHEEIDSELGDQHIKQRLTALKNSEARIIVLYSTTDRTRRIFQTSNAMFPPADDVLPMIIGLAPKV
uniref:Receptor ligand binding region domain-containing protein n=1 Tax=Meloidogyne enterolobii TaxID=390850 RepID=A0A6V7XMI0_MELEN|nr:unnamed protein product [Meloidogyne enterolobii]